MCTPPSIWGQSSDCNARKVLQLHFAIDCSILSTDKLFLMGIKDLLYHLEDIVMRWYQLGVQLNVPLNKLNEIRCNNPSDVYQCKLLMLQEWQRQPTLKPSWCTLVDALYSMEENVIADRIAQQFSELHFSPKLVI